MLANNFYHNTVLDFCAIQPQTMRRLSSSSECCSVGRSITVAATELSSVMWYASFDMVFGDRE